jgi:purine-nucleoside phosphorylase
MIFDEVTAAAAAVRSRLGGRAPTVGLVLGSGLGSWADRLGDAARIDYKDIPGFPVSTVHGHAGKLVVGTSGGTVCAAMQGRVHYYEGHELPRVVFPVRTLIALGCTTLIVTNAAGGVNAAYAPGDLVLIADHLNLLPSSPLRGENDERLGPRFPDMTQAYDPALRQLAREVARGLGFEAKEGVYACSQGPAYETPAEVRMARALGADLVGMSTVPEVIAARHMGARVLGISCVTNLAAGLSGQPLSHDEVTETAARVRERFTALLDGVVAGLATGPAAGPAARLARGAH